MSPWWIAALALLLVLFGLYLSMTAGRLDRLHVRIATAELGLEAHLLRRSSIALELAGTGLLDPASSALLADAAHEARVAPESDSAARNRAESNLTWALMAVFPDDEVIDELDETQEGGDLVSELAASCARVALSRRFLNDGVRACRAVRRQRLARWFRLAGHTPWPESVELDDTVPPVLATHQGRALP